MPRCVVDVEAMFLLLQRQARVPCRIVELSPSGCRLGEVEGLPANLVARVETIFKLRGIAFRLSGVMERSGGKDRARIRFLPIPSRRRDELAEVLRELEAENLARAKRQAAEKLAAEKQAQERAAEEKAELLARKHGEPRAAAEEPRPPARPSRAPRPAELQEAVPTAAKAGNRDRRAQSRHEVDTTAEILLINIGARLRGRILDLSLSGCRIRTDERFPVGIYTRVETEFRLEGLPVRLGGVIQAIHGADRLHVGIRFLDLTKSKREQVEQLIQEIEASRNPAWEEDSGEGMIKE